MASGFRPANAQQATGLLDVMKLATPEFMGFLGQKAQGYGQGLLDALMAPGNALAGQYDQYYDPSSGQTTWGRNGNPYAMMGDASNLSGMVTLGAGAVPGEVGALRSGANLSRFMEGSGVVDAAGAPKPMYHATASDFTEFKPLRGVTFLADTPQGAMKGASGGSYDNLQAGSADRIMPLYVQAKAIEHTQPPPKIMQEIAALPDVITEAQYNAIREGRQGEFGKALSWAYSDGVEKDGVWYLSKDMSQLRKPLAEVMKTGRDWSGQLIPGYNTSIEADQRMAARMKREGYDATVVNDESGVALVVPNSQQMKSVFNRGTFDPADPNIMRSVGGVPVAGTQQPQPSKKLRLSM